MRSHEILTSKRRAAVAQSVANPRTPQMEATAMRRRSFLYLIARGSFNWSRITFHQLVVNELKRIRADSESTQEKTVEGGFPTFTLFQMRTGIGPWSNA